MGGYVIVSEIGSQITFIRDNLPIKKSYSLLKNSIPIFYMIVIWLEKVWLVDKSACDSHLSYCSGWSYTWATIVDSAVSSRPHPRLYSSVI